MSATIGAGSACVALTIPALVLARLRQINSDDVSKVADDAQLAHQGRAY